MGCSGRRATPTAPAQTQPGSSRQAELVICDKTIERTFAWLVHHRRLRVDDEATIAASTAFIHVAMVHLTLRRLARPSR
jgi:hypothetical protein